MKIKEKIAVGLVVASILSPGLALAEEGQSTATPGGPAKIKDLREKMLKEKEARMATTSMMKEKMQEKRDEMKQKIEEARERMDKRVDEAESRMRQRLGNFIDIILDRYNAAIERLENIADRIDSRIQKLETEGIDESKAKEMLTGARGKIDVAKQSVLDLGSSIETVSGTTTPLKETFPNLKSKVEKAKQDIKDAHAALIDVVRNIKPGKNKTEHATSTATTTSNTSN